MYFLNYLMQIETLNYFIFQTTHGLEILQDALQLAATIDLGSDPFIVLELQKKLNQMKPQYQVRNQAREMHNGSKALFDTVKIHIHVDPRKSV